MCSWRHECYEFLCFCNFLKLTTLSISASADVMFFGDLRQKNNLWWLFLRKLTFRGALVQIWLLKKGSSNLTGNFFLALRAHKFAGPEAIASFTLWLIRHWYLRSRSCTNSEDDFNFLLIDTYNYVGKTTKLNIFFIKIC